jgi:hypothetical protein
MPESEEIIDSDSKTYPIFGPKGEQTKLFEVEGFTRVVIDGENFYIPIETADSREEIMYDSCWREVMITYFFD